MKIGKHFRADDSRGQALLETVLLMPLLLMVVLNALNLGYFFFVTLNLTSATRDGIEYAIQGPVTPTNNSLPTATGSGTSTVSFLIYQEMTGALNAPLSVQVRVCSASLGLTNTTPPTTKCQTCQNSSCTTTAAAGNPDSDPETTNGFSLNRVDVTYTFQTLVPATIFNLAVTAFPTCSSSLGTVTCTFYRHADMRAM